jgi:TusA-related sulfurtransferase
MQVTAISMTSQQEILEIDARGLRCPMPLLKAKQGISSLEPGERIMVRATDSASFKDIPGWVSIAGHTLIEHEEKKENGEPEFVFVIEKNCIG